MTMRNFIKENQEKLDACIKRVCPNCRLNNDEGLYLWAKSEGVRI